MVVSKRVKENTKHMDSSKLYSFSDAIIALKKCMPAKFDQTIEVSLRLGVDPKKSDQQVRGTVALPNGTGKTCRVLVLTKGDKEKEALDAGADYVGHDELIEKIKSGWLDFDVVVATPDMMREVGKLGKVLGPRGLMPSPKAGTVTQEVAKAVKEIKGGKIEFKIDKHGVINNAVGKISFDNDKLLENINEFVSAIKKAKPPAAKGNYFMSLSLSSTHGPGFKIDVRGE